MLRGAEERAGDPQDLGEVARGLRRFDAIIELLEARRERIEVRAAPRAAGIAPEERARRSRSPSGAQVAIESTKGTSSSVLVPAIANRSNRSRAPPPDVLPLALASLAGDWWGG